MSEGITLKRIIDMDEATELTSSDYALVDSSTGGPKKFALGGELSSLKEDLDDVETALETKAEIDGYYEEMTVGDAEQLVSTVTNADDTPYNFRTTAGSVDAGDRAYVDAIVGGTLCVNQLAYAINADNWYANQSTINFSNGVATFTATAQYGGMLPLGNAHRPVIINEHKYMFLGEIKKTTASADVTFGITFGNAHFLPIKNSANWEVYSAIVASTNTGLAQINCQDNRTSGWDANQARNIMVFDLTATFGTTIADYIYSLETATAGAGVAWLKANAPKIFDGGYIPFNAGTLQSVVGLSEKRNTGLNQWDEVAEVGGINHSTGANVANSTVIRSKNYVPCLPSTTYYFENLSNAGSPYIHYYDADKNFVSYAEVTRNTTFTTPANARYIRFNMDTAYGTTYNHDICINLHWDGEKDGTYEPYTVHTYAFDPTVELRGVPKLKDGKMYFDGDRYLPDGTVQRRYGIVDLGSLTWSQTQAGYFYTTSINTILKKGSAAGGYDHIKCALFVAQNIESLNNLTDKSMSVDSGGNIQIHDSAYPDNNAFKTAMSGVYLVYEKATASTETAEPYNLVEIVDDFGTEEFITTNLVPVGHETRYAPNLRAKLEMSPDSPDGDGLYIVQQSSGENTYIPLASSATIQDILARLTALEGNTNEG